MLVVVTHSLSGPTNAVLSSTPLMAEQSNTDNFFRFQLERVQQMGLIVVLGGEKAQRLVGILLLMAYSSLGKIIIINGLGN